MATAAGKCVCSAAWRAAAARSTPARLSSRYRCTKAAQRCTWNAIRRVVDPVQGRFEHLELFARTLEVHAGRVEAQGSGQRQAETKLTLAEPGGLGDGDGRLERPSSLIKITTGRHGEATEPLEERDAFVGIVERILLGYEGEPRVRVLGTSPARVACDTAR